MSGYSVKVAEFAIGNTHVGGIDVPVDLPGDFPVRYLFFSKLISHMHKFSQGGLVKQKQSLFSGQILEVQGFLV